MVKVVVDTTDRACPIDPAFSYADRVQIELTDGRIFDSGDIRFARGNAELPMDAVSLRNKFLDCIAAGASPDKGLPGAVLYERIVDLENLANLRQLFS
jgi:hypothetical protein